MSKRNFCFETEGVPLKYIKYQIITTLALHMSTLIINQAL
jgi:hypothetical protein